MIETVETCIVGAGPSGLTAALNLAKNGRKVTVLEADPHYVGGISRTVDCGGYRMDIGGHRFFSKSSEINAMWNEILPNGFLERPRLSRIFYKKRFFPYPLDIFATLKNLGIVESLRCMLSFGAARFHGASEIKTFHQWVASRFGERLFSIFFKTYTEKVWGMSCDQISADWAAQRIKDLDLKVAVVSAIKSLFRFSSSGTPKSLISRFKYPARGPGMMWEAAAARIKAFGGVIAMGEKVVEVREDPAGFLVLTSTGRRVQCQNLIWSGPLNAIARYLGGESAKALSDDLKYRDFMVVGLALDRPADFNDNWLYIHDPDVRVGRIQNFGSWSPEMVPSQNVGYLGLEYFLQEGDGIWSLTDAEIIAMATRELRELDICTSASITAGYVVRQSKAYPVYDDGYKERVNTIVDALKTRHPRLQMIGRNGLHRYNNMDHAMMTGVLAARNIVVGTFDEDPRDINDDAEYHEGDVKLAAESVRLVPEAV